MSFGHESHEGFGDFFSSQRKPNGRDYTGSNPVADALREVLSGLGGPELGATLKVGAIAKKNEDDEVKTALFEALKTRASLKTITEIGDQTVKEYEKAVAERDKTIAERDKAMAALRQQSRELQIKLSNADAAKMVAESNERFAKSQLQAARDTRDQYWGEISNLTAEIGEIGEREQRLLQLVSEINAALSAGATLTPEDIAGAKGRATNLNYKGKKFLKVNVKPAPAPEAPAENPVPPAADAAAPVKETPAPENPLAGLGPEGLTNGDF